MLQIRNNILAFATAVLYSKMDKNPSVLSNVIIYGAMDLQLRYFFAFHLTSC